LRKAYLPQLEVESRRLDKTVRDYIIMGLLSCGWENDALEKTELKQILDEEESIITARHAKRLRGGDEELAYGYAPQLDPLGKRQKQRNPLLSNYSQTFPEEIHNVSAGEITPPVDCAEANEVSEESTSIQLDSQPLIIANVDASLDGNMQGIRLYIRQI
jgi:hypothetical protein